MTIKHYFDNPLTFEFTATVVEAIINDDDTSNIVLDQTYFYPTGGGQAHDQGMLEGHSIVDVRKEGETVVHIIAGDPPLTGTVRGIIDKSYRLRNMAAHTGQHILSAILLKQLNAETVAVRMNAVGLSTVDVTVPDLTDEQMNQVETQANDVIRANHPVKSRFVAPDSPELEQLRRAVKFDKVTGNVRLVEIDSVDLSACAGTHMPTTGRLGLLKILKVENYKGGSRLHFAVGAEALDQFRTYHHVLDTVSNALSSGIEQVPDLIQKLQSERADLAKQLATEKEQRLSLEAQSILASAAGEKIVLGFTERTTEALRTLANVLVESQEHPVMIHNQQGEDVALILATPEAHDLHAGNTLKAILTQFGGKGGGREGYAQGILYQFDDLDALKAAIAQHLA